ncbi:hypothetical protein PO909_017943 [Leuciscus waleckii]
MWAFPIRGAAQLVHCVVDKLRRTTDLALRATRQTAASIGRSIAAMVATEIHLWLNLADIGLNSVETVMEKFTEAKAAFKSCIPLQSKSTPRQPGGPGPSRFKDRRQGQRFSITSRAPRPPRIKSHRLKEEEGSEGGASYLRPEAWTDDDIFPLKRNPYEGLESGLVGKNNNNSIWVWNNMRMG